MGEQLAAPGASSCVPLACDAPLAPAEGVLAASLSCAGCGGGSAGAPLSGGCSPAGCEGMVCPGLLSLPLVNFSAGAGGSSRAGAAWAAAPPLLAPAGGAEAAGSALAPSASMATVFAGGTLVGALLILALVVSCTRLCPAPSTALLKRVDAFSLRPPLREGEPPTLRAAALGGVFTLMGVLTLLTYALYMVLEWRFNNTLVQRSLSTLGEGWSRALLGGAAWMAAPTAPAATPLLLRVMVDGEPGRCDAPLSWAGAGLAPGGGAWTLRSAPSVGGSGVAAHTFSCAGCVLTPTATLTASFHYSCQSMLLEAAAGAPGEEGGGGSVGGGPAPRAAAGIPGALLASVKWTLTPLLAMVSNNMTARTYAGYTFTGSAFSTALVPLVAPSGGGRLLTVAPAAASVLLSVALPLDSVYTQVTLTQRVPWTQLLANIVGLSGVVGFFGMLYGQLETRLIRAGGKKDLLAAVAAPAATAAKMGAALRESALEDSMFAVNNPLRVGPLPLRQRSSVAHVLPNGGGVRAGGNNDPLIDAKLLAAHTAAIQLFSAQLAALEAQLPLAVAQALDARLPAVTGALEGRLGAQLDGLRGGLFKMASAVGSSAVPREEATVVAETSKVAGVGAQEDDEDAVEEGAVDGEVGVAPVPLWRRVKLPPPPPPPPLPFAITEDRVVLGEGGR